MTDISKSIYKTDGDEKISGQAKYIADIKVDGMLHAVTLRSKIAKGRIKNIVLTDLPEGYFSVSAKDIPGKNSVKIIFDDQKIFADKEVTYIDEPIMLIVGEDKQKVIDIINNTEVEYEELEPN